MVEPQHWSVTVAERLGVAPERFGLVALGTPKQDVWKRLADRTHVPTTDLAAAVAEHFKLDVADFDRAEPRAIKLCPEGLARKYGVFPLREDDRHLVVATSDPTDLALEQDIGFASGRRPVFAIAPPEAVAKALDDHYSPDRAMDGWLQAVGEADALNAVEVVEETQAEAIATSDVEAEPVVKLANLILREAVKQRASDIHVEPGRHGGHVRLRVDGVMREFMSLPMPALNRVISRLKILSALDIADRLRPQDGKARVRIADRVYDLRTSTVPTRDAEKAVLRILDPQSAPTLAELQLPAPELARFRDLLGHRDGIVLVTGPTGSGKTTTLYAALRALATGAVNIMTVEDPVEYELPGITQIQVETKRAVTFASALRAILRQDPDIILVGEIRDRETADIALRASLTGHFVLATLHTNNAVGALTRLIDLGLDRTVIAGALRGAVAQRLARRVCSACAVRLPIDVGPSAGEPRASEQLRQTPTVRVVGCDACGQTGYRGRMAVMEVAVVSPEVRDLITAGGDERSLQRAAVAAGMRPLREVALDHVAAGLTTVEEVDRVLGDAAEGPSATGQTRVLLVDDDPVARALARAVLEKDGFHVAESVDGAAALELLGAGEPVNLVVLDLDMPRLGGRDVLRRLRGELSFAALPVVVLTASDNQELEVQLMNEGADDYIRKPLEPARFLARVNAALRRAGAG